MQSQRTATNDTNASRLSEPATIGHQLAFRLPLLLNTLYGLFASWRSFGVKNTYKSTLWVLQEWTQTRQVIDCSRSSGAHDLELHRNRWPCGCHCVSQSSVIIPISILLRNRQHGQGHSCARIQWNEACRLRFPGTFPILTRLGLFQYAGRGQGFDVLSISPRVPAFAEHNGVQERITKRDPPGREGHNAVIKSAQQVYLYCTLSHIYSFDLTTEAAFSQRPFLSSPGSPSYISLSTAREFIWESFTLASRSWRQLRQ